jgi:tetratricopeptide (TPR) repeat protein
MLALLAAGPGNPVHVERLTRWLLTPGPGRDGPDPGSAEPWLRRLESLAPEAIQTAELRARSLVARGEGDEAARLLAGHAERHPEQSRSVAMLLDTIGRPDEAVAMLRGLATSEEGEAAAISLFLQSRVLERMGRFDEAEATLRRFVEAIGRPEASLDLAEFLGRRGRVDEALDLCDLSWETCPPAKVARAATVSIYEPGVPVAAINRVAAGIQRALGDHPADAGLLFYLGNIRALQGDPGEAERLFRESVDRDELSSGAVANLAWIIAVRDPSRATEARSIADRGIWLLGPLPDLLNARAAALMRLGDAPGAIADLERAVVDPQPDPIWMLHLAQAYLMADRVDDAGRTLDLARESGLADDRVPELERSSYAMFLDELARRRDG